MGSRSGASGERACNAGDLGLTAKALVAGLSAKARGFFEFVAPPLGIGNETERGAPPARSATACRSK
jgi:hypothetical protein